MLHFGWRKRVVNRVCGSFASFVERIVYVVLVPFLMRDPHTWVLFVPVQWHMVGFPQFNLWILKNRYVYIYIYIWYILIWFIIWHLSSWYSPIQLSRRSSVTAPSLAGDICGGVWVRSMNQGNLQAFFINKNRKNTSRWFRGSCPIPGAVFMEVGRRATRKITHKGSV